MTVTKRLNLKTLLLVTTMLASPLMVLAPLPTMAQIAISVQIEPPEIEPILVPSEDTRETIDWAMEAHRAATATQDAPKTREFGSYPKAGSSGELQHREPTHRAGESDRDINGDKVFWVSDNCFVVSEAPPLGTPDVFARMAPTRTACIEPRAPEGELFKDSSAYKKYHPQ